MAQFIDIHCGASLGQRKLRSSISGLKLL